MNEKTENQTEEKKEPIDYQRKQIEVMQRALFVITTVNATALGPMSAFNKCQDLARKALDERQSLAEAGILAEELAKVDK